MQSFLWAVHGENLLQLPREKRHFLLFRIFLDTYVTPLKDSDVQETAIGNGIDVYETRRALLSILSQPSGHYLVDTWAFEPGGATELLQWWLTARAKFSLVVGINPENAHCVRRLLSNFRCQYIDYISLAEYNDGNEAVSTTEPDGAERTTSVCGGPQDGEAGEPHRSNQEKEQE